MKIFGKTLTLQKTIPWVLVVCGSIGLLCAGIITYDKIRLLENPTFVPGCDLNPVISCGSVMQSAQAHAFGIPNPFIGLAGFAIVATIGMAMLAGATFKRWFWLGLQVGTIFGIGFVHWLFFESVYRIQALCPYCMVVWVMTITLFWYVTLFNIQTGVIKLRGTWQKIGFFARRHHLDMLLFWLIAIALFTLQHFWYYYGKHLHL